MRVATVDVLSMLLVIVVVAAAVGGGRRAIGRTPMWASEAEQR